MEKKDFKYILTLIPITFIAFFSTVWIRPADLMEARNFITAREMILNDNFIVPTLNGSLRFEKPPLPTWLTAGIMKLTENFTDEYILRIPSALCGILFIILLYCFVKYMTKDSFKSFITSFVGATTFMIIKISNENAWDIYTYVFAFGGVLFLIKGFQQEKIFNFFISGIFIACSILSKGPVGIYGLIFPFLISYSATYGLGDYQKNWKKIVFAFLIGIIFSGIWFGLMYIKYPEIFLNVMKKEENTWNTLHTESFIYYMDYFVYMGIWIFFSIVGLFKSWNKKRTDNKEYYKFVFLWNILVILFLSFIQMKKKRYGLPIYMTSIMEVGIICSYYYDKLWYELKKSDKILLYIQSVFMLILSIVIPILFFFKGYVYEKISSLYMGAILLIFSIFGYLILKFILGKEKTMKFIILGSGVFMLIVNLTTNWFFDKTLVKKAYGSSNYNELKLVRKNPPKYDIYAQNFEIEDVWRFGKNIKKYENYKIEKNVLPDNLVFLGEVPKEILKEYKVLKKEIYIKDDGHLAELNYLKKFMEA